MDLAARDDARPQPAPTHEESQDLAMRRPREQAAGLAKLEAFEHSAPDCETLAAKIIESNTPRHDVAPGHLRGQRKASLTYERLDVLELDESHMLVWFAAV